MGQRLIIPQVEGQEEGQEKRPYFHEIDAKRGKKGIVEGGSDVVKRGLEEAELERVLGDVERDHVRHARDAREDARRGRVHLVHLR